MLLGWCPLFLDMSPRFARHIVSPSLATPNNYGCYGETKETLLEPPDQSLPESLPTCWKLLKSSNFGSVLEHDPKPSKLGKLFPGPGSFGGLDCSFLPGWTCSPTTHGPGPLVTVVEDQEFAQAQLINDIRIRCLKWGDKTWQWEIHVFVAKPFGNDPLVIFHRQIRFMEGPCLQFAWGSSEFLRDWH